MKPTIIISLIVALVFFSLGYFLRDIKVNPIGQLTKETNNTYQDGWDAAKKRLVDSGFIPATSNFEIKNVSGQVIAVQGDAVILKIAPLEPLADSNLDERIVKIDAGTKIYALEQKDPAQYQSEMAEFNKKMQEQLKNPPKPDQAPSNIVLPEFFIKKEISLSDIKVGEKINVTATDKDIKNTKQFSAAEITIQPTSVTAVPTGTPLPTSLPASQ